MGGADGAGAGAADWPELGEDEEEDGSVGPDALAELPALPDESVRVVFFCAGSGSGVKGLCAAPLRWSATPAVVSATAFWGAIALTDRPAGGAAEAVAAEPAGVAALEPPPSATYPTAANRPMPTTATNGSRRRSSRSALREFRKLVMGSLSQSLAWSGSWPSFLTRRSCRGRSATPGWRRLRSVPPPGARRPWP